MIIQWSKDTSSSLSRPGRSTLDSGRWKKMHGAVGMLDMSFFKSGQFSHAESCMCPAESPYPLKYPLRVKQSRQKARILCNIMWFCACEPTQSYGKHLLNPVSRLWEHCLSDPFSKIWETTSLSCPDTWVRKPDTTPGLPLPYNPSLLGSSPHNLHEDIFHRVPLVRRAEPCSHKPQQQYRLN